MRPHILLLTTGGTIASLPTAEGLAPGLDGEALAGLLPQGIMDCYDITIRDILHLDSSNIQPEEWQTIARHVFENRMEYSGIVITHGTDTMAYTASVLSFMLRGISIPVVLTGAQLPMAHPLSAGMENLRTALALGLSLKETQRLLAVGGCGALYPRVRRDAAVIFALNQKMSLLQAEELLSSLPERSLYAGEH